MGEAIKIGVLALVIAMVVPQHRVRVIRIVVIFHKLVELAGVASPSLGIPAANSFMLNSPFDGRHGIGSAAEIAQIFFYKSWHGWMYVDVSGWVTHGVKQTKLYLTTILFNSFCIALSFNIGDAIFRSSKPLNFPSNSWKWKVR